MHVGRVTRVIATFRPSRHVKMVWRVANMTTTSHACRVCGIWRTTLHVQTGSTTAADRPCSLNVKVASIVVTSTGKLLPWNLAITVLLCSVSLPSICSPNTVLSCQGHS